MPLELNLQQANRLSLEAHFLLHKASPSGLVSVVGDVCGLNAQTARAPYLSLRARIAGFRRSWLTKALFEEKLLVKMWLMRGTVHIIPTRDLVIYQRALRRHLVEGWQRQLYKQSLMLPAGTRTKLHRKIIDRLAQEPCTKKELLTEVEAILRDHNEQEQKRRLGWALRELSYAGRVCHGRPLGPWYHFKEHRFAAVKDWLPPKDLDKLDEEEARQKLLMRYLHGYGPASVQDFGYWAGFNITDSKKIFRGIESELAEVRIRDVNRSLWMLREDISRLEDVIEKEKPPVCFLPEFDALIMGHRDKARIMDDKHRRQVFLRLADVAPVILLDGRVAGTWDYRMTTKSLNLSAFEPLKPGDHEEIVKESTRLRQFFDLRG